MPRILLFLSLLVMAACQGRRPEVWPLASPDGQIEAQIRLSADGQVSYEASFAGNAVILPSEVMQFELVDAPPMQGGWELVRQTAQIRNETWEMPWGEQRKVVNAYRSQVLTFRERQAPKRTVTFEMRAFNDGLAFRYHFAKPETGDAVLKIKEERSVFQLAADHTCWWIPGDWDIYEHLYTESSFSQIDATTKRNHPSLAQTHIPVNAVNTPITMRTREGIHLSFHEANLTDYAGMTLQIMPDNRMVSNLVGSERRPHKVELSLPARSPWRTIQISQDAPGLIASRMILNLNEPSRIKDISWFKPMKYVGIWWEMHLGKSSWDLFRKDSTGQVLPDSLPNGTHGATTANAKRFIDFAAENNIGGVLVEGWNMGWERWIGFEDREGVFDFITPYPDYDLEEVVAYAKSKGVQIIMHHETSAAPRTYEQQLDTAFGLMKRLGIHSVKTGYVGKIIPKGEYHHGQWMVNHYRKVLETAANYQVAINAHEPIKATGIRRTWPNAISREGLRGQEFNAWSADGGNPPSHLPTVAFTRMLAGPIDYTPGIFNIKLDPYKPNNQVNTTLAHQLALYVVIYSPVQMAADLIEHYQGQPGLQFIREVGVDWEQTQVINGEVGDFVTIARQERGTERWFLGSITDETPRQLTIRLDFLKPGLSYQAHIYEDAADAHWDQNPTALRIRQLPVSQQDALQLDLAAGGGAAISFIPNP